MWETDANGNQVWVPATSLPSDVQPFDTSNYWQADEQTSGSVTNSDILSFLSSYPEYTGFFTSDLVKSALSGLGNAAKSLITDSKGAISPAKIATLAGGILGGTNPSWMNTPQQPVGYQGGIPTYTAVREQVPQTYDPNRRPGSRGQEYFTQTQFVNPSAVATAQATAAQQAAEAEARNKARTAEMKSAPPRQDYAAGGIAALAKGTYLAGATDGMADKIPATIEDKQPAKLSHGEFVIPADVVSHLGNGNSEAGAQRLYGMMDKVRKARTGTTKQGKQINPTKFMPG